MFYHVFIKSVPTQDCLRKSFNTHLRKMLTRRLCPKQNSLHNFSTVPFLYKRNHLQKTWLNWEYVHLFIVLRKALLFGECLWRRAHGCRLSEATKLCVGFALKVLALL